MSTLATTAVIAQAGIIITVLAQPSDSNAYKSLAECMSKGQIRRLLEKADSNVWHWADVEVLAEYQDIDGKIYTASEYLGGCSYSSRPDFVMTSGYYDDMLQTVTEDIMNQVAEAHK
jgi:hypothetical protein